MSITNIHVVCIDPERGRWLAYNREDPSDKAEGDSSGQAVGLLVDISPNSPITVTEIEP